MLEGLEVSIVDFKNIATINSVFRFDSEYFQKSYLFEDKQVGRYNLVTLGKIAFVTDGQHGYHEIDEESPIAHLTAKNFKNWFADRINAEPLAKWVDLNNQRSSLKVNDVVLTTRGTVGCCAIVKPNVLPANIDQDVARIELSQNSHIKPQFLLSYINSKYGQDWIKRNSTGMVQQGLALWRVKEMPVPKMNDIFQETIETTIETSSILIEQSQTFYSQAEFQVLSELGLANWQPTQQNNNTKTFKSSFGTTGRFDAEYYQPKYDEMYKKFEKYNLVSLEELTNYPIVSGSTPKAGDSTYYTTEKDGIAFVRAVDISKGKVSLDNVIYIQRFIHETSQRRTQLKTGDVLFSIAGTVGRCGIYEHDAEANVNQACAILRFDEDVILKHYLVVFFNSWIGKLVVEQVARQGVQTNLNLEELSSITIPVLNMQSQIIIAERVEESNRLLQQSKELLERAKRAVEIAIEQSEEIAMKYLEGV